MAPINKNKIKPDPYTQLFHNQTAPANII